MRRPDIPPDLEAAIMRCLKHDPNERFPDVAHFARAIAPFGSGACALIPDAIEQTLRQQLRRYSGQAMIVKPVALASTSQVSATSTTQEAPAVTEDSVPELRPRRTKTWVALAVVATAGATYGLLVNAHLLKRLDPSALPPDVTATSSVLVASASAPSASIDAREARGAGDDEPPPDDERVGAPVGVEHDQEEALTSLNGGARPLRPERRAFRRASGSAGRRRPRARARSTRRGAART